MFTRASRFRLLRSGTSQHFKGAVLPLAAVKSDMASSRAICSILALAACATFVYAQGDTAPKATLSLSSPKAFAGKTYKAVLTVTFAEGLHGYQNPPSDPTLIPVTVKLADKTFKLVAVSYPKGVPATVGGESKPVNVYEGTVKIPITLTAPTKLGKTSLNLTFGYQQCNSAACFPPGTVTVKAVVTVIKAPPVSPTAKAAL